MMRRGIGSLTLGLGLLLLASGVGSVAAQSMAPPGGDFKKASELVGLPDFVPGLGTLYVEPARMPVGPYLAYDRDGHLVSTVYMISLKDITAHTKFDKLEVAPGVPVDHVDMVFDAGHPGMPDPHYNVILWYIPKAKASALK
jgi:hypothetical protein